MDNVNLSIHRVARTRLTGPHELPCGGLTYDLEVITEEGVLEITLFAEAPITWETRPTGEEAGEPAAAIAAAV